MSQTLNAKLLFLYTEDGEHLEQNKLTHSLTHLFSSISQLSFGTLLHFAEIWTPELCWPWQAMILRLDSFVEYSSFKVPG
jgi:hypothetical protein